MKELLWVLFVSFLLNTSPVRAADIPNAEMNQMMVEIYGDGTYSTSDHSAASRKQEAFRRDFGTLEKMAERTNAALNGIFKIAVKNLHRHDFDDVADEVESGWRNHNGELQQLVYTGSWNSSRDIGDFDPLSKWLADAYNKIEGALGYQLCYMLRLSDIKTLNYGLVVVFNPCKYGETEFAKHFIHDMLADGSTKPNGYRGVAPVVSFWVTDITCSIATYGAGSFFICSPIAMLVELGVDKVVAPWLEPKIYHAVCG